MLTVAQQAFAISTFPEAGVGRRLIPSNSWSFTA